MSSRTRVRLMIGLILGLITLPAEALLLPIARTPDLRPSPPWNGPMICRGRTAVGVAPDRRVSPGLSPRDHARARSARPRRCVARRTCAAT